MCIPCFEKFTRENPEEEIDINEELQEQARQEALKYKKSIDMN
jgi:hypothetical protein